MKKQLFLFLFLLISSVGGMLAMEQGTNKEASNLWKEISPDEDDAEKFNPSGEIEQNPGDMTEQLLKNIYKDELLSICKHKSSPSIGAVGFRNGDVVIAYQSEEDKDATFTYANCHTHNSTVYSIAILDDRFIISTNYIKEISPSEGNCERQMYIYDLPKNVQVRLQNHIPKHSTWFRFKNIIIKEDHSWPADANVQLFVSIDRKRILAQAMDEKNKTISKTFDVESLKNFIYPEETT